MGGIIEAIKIWNKETWERIQSNGKNLVFDIPGPPVGQEHEQDRKRDPFATKGAGRYTADRTRQYLQRCGWYARKAVADHRQQGSWPYDGDVWMDVEIYYLRKYPRPDPENVIATLQDGFTKILWKNDRNVLGRPNYHWWPGKNADIVPPQFMETGRYVGGVIITITRV